MNFIAAIQHASIGFYIRRKQWPNYAMLRMEGVQLWWVNGVTFPANLLGIDKTGDVSAEDIQANDWEYVRSDITTYHHN